MSLEMAIELFRQAIYNALMLVSPILITTIVVGLTVSLVQAVTSIQEQHRNKQYKIVVGVD